MRDAGEEQREQRRDEALARRGEGIAGRVPSDDFVVNRSFRVGVDGEVLVDANGIDEGVPFTLEDPKHRVRRQFESGFTSIRR